ARPQTGGWRPAGSARRHRPSSWDRDGRARMSSRPDERPHPARPAGRSGSREWRGQFVAALEQWVFAYKGSGRTFARNSMLPTNTPIAVDQHFAELRAPGMSRGKKVADIDCNLGRALDRIVR